MITDRDKGLNDVIVNVLVNEELDDTFFVGLYSNTLQLIRVPPSPLQFLHSNLHH